MVAYLWGRGEQGQLATQAASSLDVPRRAEELVGKALVCMAANLEHGAAITGGLAG